MNIVVFVVAFLFLFQGSKGNSSWYDHCNRLVTCGSFVPVGFPFWGGKWRPKECGYPHFRIGCEDGITPTLVIDGMEYIIKNVNELDRVIRVSRKDYSTQGPCLKRLVNTTVNWNEFQYAPTTTNWTVLYGCELPKSPVYGNFSCKIKGVASDTGYCVKGIVSPIDYRCNLSVVVQSLVDPIIGLDRVFEYGFQLNYTLQNEDEVFCQKCEGAVSNGTCGYDNSRNRTVCVCPYGSEDIMCKINSTSIPPPTPPTQSKHGPWRVVVIASSIGAFAAVAILLFIIWRWTQGSRSPPRETLFHDVPLFELSSLLVATDHFSLANKLGQGGFGPVYKGILEDGQQIAVKRLQTHSSGGDEQFLNEVTLISKLQHNNLVRLLGCCMEEQEKLLVYEFMPNKSLDSILFDREASKSLTWERRFDIILGICRGLLYLHRDSRLKIIHRDLKTGNVLLDADLNPKISDFGTARIFSTDQDQANTQRAAGTYGYMSPEYALQGAFSEKSDVFSLGVMLLEIISGRSNRSLGDEDGIVAYAWKNWRAGDLGPLIDQGIGHTDFEEQQIVKYIQIALLCVQERVSDRPKMDAILSMMETQDVNHLPNPNPPSTLQQSPQQHGSGSGSGSVNLVSLTTLSART